MKPKLPIFFEVLERQVNEIQYGNLSVNVILVNGVPKMETLNVVKSRRTKYPTKDELAET
jgi:hypothetical protein